MYIHIFFIRNLLYNNYVKDFVLLNYPLYGEAKEDKITAN